MPRLRLLVLLAGLTMFGPMSLDAYLPAFPEIADQFGADTGSVQLTLSACLLGLGLGQVLWGPVSDRYGRKGPMSIGVGVYIVASLLIALAPSMPAMVGLRFVQALGGAAGVVIARAMVRDLFSGVELARAMSLIVTVFALAPVLAPLLGSAVLVVASWQWIFVGLAVFGGLCLVGIARMPETLTREHRTDHGLGGAVRQYGTIVSDPRFRFAAVIAALGSTALFSYISSSPAALIDSFGLSESAFALSFAGLSLCFALGAQINMRLLKRRRVIVLLRASVATQVVASVAVLLAGALHAGLILFMLPLVVALMTVAGVNSNGIALALDPFPRSAASAAALVGGLQMAMGALASAALSAMTLPPPLEMGLAMTAASTLSLAIIVASVLRVRRAASSAVGVAGAGG